MCVKIAIFFLFLLSADAKSSYCPPQCHCGNNSIDCSQRSLISLSDIYISLSNYMNINVSANHLSWLPVISVKHLDASSNLLQEFPVIGEPIETLTLKNNSIRFIEFQECPSTLKHLDLSENPIKVVDLKCDGLETLDLSQGDIETLPDNFLANFQSLQTLVIDGNPLKKISGELSSNTLEVISLQRTQLRYIKPSLFVSLSKIKVLNISGNKYIHMLNLQSGAEVILASHCSLETVDLSDMPRVRSVDVSHNHLNNLILPSSVLELKASDNTLYNINLGRIKKADLSRNFITSLYLEQMEFLNISRNPISHLTLSSINYLDASQCKLSSIEVHGSKFNILNLSHNALETFPEGLSAKKLDISFNRLIRLKSRIDGIEELWLVGNRFVLAEDLLAQGKMYLRDNPWTCDCKMDHLYKSANDAKSLTCFHPRNVSGHTWSEVCYKGRIPKWMLNKPYIPFVVSVVFLILALLFFYWLRRKIDPPQETNENEEERTITETVPREVRINNQLPSYEEALLMPGIARKKNALTQTRSYEVLSKRLSSNSI